MCLTKTSLFEPPWPWPHLQDAVQVAGVAQVVQAHKRQHVVSFLTADKGGGLCCRNHLVTEKQRIRVRNTLENHSFISARLRATLENSALRNADQNHGRVCLNSLWALQHRLLTSDSLSNPPKTTQVSKQEANLL